MKKACTILTLILTCSLCWAQGFDLQKQISFASYLDESGNADRALKAYLRAYYEDRNNEVVELPIKISQLFSQKNDYQNALLFSEKYLYQTNLDLTQKEQGHYEKVSILLKTGLFQEARLTLYEMNQNVRMLNPDRFNYYLSMAFILSNDFEKAISTIEKLSYIDQEHEQLAIRHVLEDLEKIQNTKHQKARWMSTVVPGLGQAVNGEFKDGLNSLGLLSGLLWVFLELNQSLNTLDAIWSVGPWAGRYYVGGLGNAVKASKNKAENKKREEILKLNAFLSRKKAAQNN